MIVIIDGRTIEHGLYEISSFGVTVLYTARLLSSLSLVIYFFSFLCFLVYILIIDGRIIEYGTLILEFSRGQTDLWCLRSNRTLHSPSIIFFVIRYLFIFFFMFSSLYFNNRRENNRTQNGTGPTFWGLR